LTWNIIRDLVKDRTKLRVVVAFGGIVPSTDKSGSSFFVEEGSVPGKKTIDKRVMFTIVNIGRRPVGIHSIGGTFRSSAKSRGEVAAGKFQVISTKFPRMLQPYEAVTELTPKVDEIFEHLNANRVKNFYARDTKGKEWKASRKNIRSLLKSFKNSKK